MVSTESKQANNRWLSLLAALYPAGLLFLYIPLDMARRNTEIFIPDNAWFIGLSACFLLFWGLFTWILRWALKTPDAARSGMQWAVLIGMVAVCQWAAFQPVIGRQPLVVALILDVAVLAAVWALFRFVAVRHLLNLMALGGGVVLISAGQILWFSPFLDDVKMGASQRPRSNIDTYHRELAPQTLPETPNVYHILLDGFQKEFVREAMRRAGVEEELKDFDVLDTLITDSWSTHWSFAFLMAGRVLKDGESWMEFEHNAFQNGLADSLHRRGMRIYQYVSHPYQCLKGKSYCRDAKEFASSRVGHWPLVDLTFLNMLPGSLRHTLEGHAIRKTNTWSYDFSLTSLLGREKNIASDDIPAFSNRVLAGASEDEIKRAEKGNYVYLHLLNPHYPWILDRDCGYRGRDWNDARTMILEQHACALRQLERFVTALKETGHYENSLIVVHADHGNLTVNGIISAGMADFVNFPINKNRFNPRMASSDQAPKEEIDVSTAGILLIKMPEGQSNILKNKSHVQYPDIYRLVVKSAQAEMPGHLKSETREPRVLLTRTGSFSNIPERFARFTKQESGDWRFEKWIVPSDAGNAWEAPKTHIHKMGDYRGHVLLWLGNHPAAVHKMGSINLIEERIGDRDLPPYVFQGLSRKAVIKKLETDPSLNMDDYVLKGWRNGIVAIRQNVEPALGEYIGERDFPPHILIASDVESLKSRIDSYLKTGDLEEREVPKTNVSPGTEKLPVPRLIKSNDNYKYNLVSFDGRFYAIPHGIPVEWKKPLQLSSRILVGNDAEALEQRMQETLTQLKSRLKKPDKAMNTGETR